MDHLQHECGIAAVYHLESDQRSPITPLTGPQDVSRLMPRMLLDLQNRGQLAAGFTTFNPKRDKLLNTHKKIGTVIEAFRLSHEGKRASIQNEYAGRAAIGHVRYATCGKNTQDSAQPFERKHGCKWKWFSIAFNGQLANVKDLQSRLKNLADYHLIHNNDTEVIQHYLSYEHRKESQPDLVEVFRNLSKLFDGAYNIAYLNAMGDMVIARDPKGFRPLCYAQDGPLFAAASESVALQNLGFKNLQDLQPGEMIIIQNNKVRIERFADPQPISHCFFEWIYFANVASTLDERSVYLSRSSLGKEMARLERQRKQVILDEDTIVVPVPDTGKAAADAMAHELNLPSVEGVIRNRYIGRTFIEGQNRLDRVRMKYTPLRQVLEGKRVILVEDTIVRSTTLNSLLKHIRDKGKAREIHVRVACPPIKAPCFYGIDMSRVGELFAPKFVAGDDPTDEKHAAMARELKADSLYYLPREAISRCIGLPESKLCQACLTSEYPTPKGEELFELSLIDRNGKGRIYDQQTQCG